MILISSFRPFDEDPTSEYRRNQLAAFASWQRVASRIFYLNAKEPQLDSARTIFIPSEPYPRIVDVLEIAASQKEWCAILNADIVIGPGFPLVEAKLKARKAKACTCWRFNFDPALGLSSAVKDDEGMDFFAAVPEVWQLAYEMVDERLRLGAGFWDSWMLSFFCTFFNSDFWNITPSRVIFHPRHGGRRYGPGVHCDSVQTYAFPHMTSASI